MLVHHCTLLKQWTPRQSNGDVITQTSRSGAQHARLHASSCWCLDVRSGSRLWDARFYAAVAGRTACESAVRRRVPQPEWRESSESPHLSSSGWKSTSWGDVPPPFCSIGCGSLCINTVFSRIAVHNYTCKSLLLTCVWESFKNLFVNLYVNLRCNRPTWTSHLYMAIKCGVKFVSKSP